MNRTNYTTQKPENVLKRVTELINSSTSKNADKEKQIALDQLHNMFANSKRKQFQKIYEDIMKRHLELCVDLRDNRLAKDGLHQYRNMALNADPNSLETVILHLLDLAEKRAAVARQKADSVALAAAAKISDLDQEETPESIMLSSMTEEGARDRTDREVVVPWLKFLWETYRAVLELVSRTPKMERVYHKACERAFKFCKDYKRVMEFRRLCDTLRMHLSNLQKMSLQPSKLGRMMFEWTPEGIELQLQTRFEQLEIATALELWNESFRTVEDIHTVIQINKKTPKPRLMAIYYEKLTRIFWVAGNYLFHAYAWWRYYSLCCECRRDMKPEERQQQASCVLLAAMCIPASLKDRRGCDGSTAPLAVGSRHGGGGSAGDDASEALAAEKNGLMAQLLDFQTNPTRQALLTDIISRGILNEVAPEFVELYNNLETQHHPLTMTQSIVPILESTRAHPIYGVYNDSLQRTTVVRAIQQLSRVYNNVRISYVQQLFVKLNFSYFEIEKLLVSAAESNQLNIQIDHMSGSFKFSTFNALSATVDDQVAQFGSRLHGVVAALNPASDTTTAARVAYFRRVKEDAAAEHNAIVERRLIIERRKENLEKGQLEKLREEQRVKLEEERLRQEEEDRRLREEEENRQKAKRTKYLEQVALLKTKRALEAVKGEAVDEEKLVNLSESSRQALLAEAQTNAQKAKAEEIRRTTEHARRLDHITRALRMEEAVLVEANYTKHVARLREKFEADKVAARVAAREQWEKAVKEQKRMAGMQAHRSAFESDLFSAQRKEHVEQAQGFKEKALSDFCQRRVAAARKKLATDRARADEERQAAADAEMRLAREAEAQLEAEAQREARAEERERQEAEERESGRDNFGLLPRDRDHKGIIKNYGRRDEPSAADSASSWGRSPASFGGDRDGGRGGGFGSGFGGPPRGGDRDGGRAEGGWGGRGSSGAAGGQTDGDTWRKK
mgnify:CR=1 FL=1